MSQGDPDVRTFLKASARLDKSLTAAIKEGKQMSILGKVAALTEQSKDFTTDTVKALDGIAEKISTAVKVRDEAVAKHHGYYDNIIKGVSDSVEAIDRLSNIPLGEGSES